MLFLNTELNDVAKDRLARTLDRYGNKVVFAYGIVDKNDLSKTVVISNFENWYDDYQNKRLQDVDPVVHIALQRNTDFNWNNEKLIKMGYSLPDFYHDAAAQGITSGRTFVIHDYAGNLATLTIMPLTEDKNLDARLVRDRSDLLMLLNETHNMLLSVYAALYRTNDLAGIRILTRREREILYFVSLGNPYHDVAERLDIATQTVRAHLSSCIQKLGAKNVVHAVRVAMRFNMIDSL